MRVQALAPPTVGPSILLVGLTVRQRAYLFVSRVVSQEKKVPLASFPRKRRTFTTRRFVSRQIT